MELSAPRPVALATTSITGFIFFGGKKLSTSEFSRTRPEPRKFKIS
jgi:hypothetical protein